MAEQASNQVRVGSKGSVGFFVNRAKRVFADNATIELHAVGFAMNNAVRAAEML
jgi:DNA-binding protein